MIDSSKRAETNATCDRRTVLTNAGKLAAAGAVAALGANGKASAAESQVGEECMTILYESGDGVHFDFDYYNNTHMPLIMEKYGDSISRFELRRGPEGSRFIATVSIWIADGEAFDAAAAIHQASLRADVPKFTNAPLYAQRDSIIGITDT